MADDGSDFARSMSIATSGLRAQAGRMRVISENIANADSTAPTAAGNSVNLEDQMLKVSANQMDYAAATSLYTRSLGLLKTAIGKR